MREARALTLTAMGAVVAVAAFEHGLGDFLQGPVAPPSIFIQSWPNSEFYRSLSGEPALTLIPSMSVSGVATMLLSVAFLVWVVRFVDRRFSATVIAALSVALLLVGGGFGPPVLGLILAAAASKVRSPLRWWCRDCPAAIRATLSAAWPASVILCVLTWFVMLFGIAALDYFAGFESEAVTWSVLAAALMILPFTLVASLARDASVSATRS